mmetsp:Transcript_30074/g.60308  ORF Transcript_30074/g.60308 Transcript_30074/m.60308 type:complete len:183 (-) Transcript_30074:3-551(-)
MGATPSIDELAKPVVSFESADSWRLGHVQALHRQFTDGNYDFGVDEETFSRFISEALHSAAVVSPILWRKFDTTGCGLVNLLEVMSGLCVMCQASVEDKAAFLFSINDFNDQGSLSYDELVVLLYLAASSTVLVSGKGVLPEENAMEFVADEAFVYADKDLSTRLDFSNFLAWLVDFFGALG